MPNWSYTTCLSLAVMLCVSDAASGQDSNDSHTVATDIGALPTLATRQALESLPSEGLGLAADGFPNVRTWRVKPDQLTPSSQKHLEESGLGAVDNEYRAPLAMPNTMILQFNPGVSGTDINGYIEENDLKVIRTFPKIGAIQVETDLTNFFRAQIGDNDANDATIRGLNKAIEHFKGDPRIQSATPDLIISGQAEPIGDEGQITNLLAPSNVFVSGNQNTTTETTDWGISDIEANQLWSMPGARDGVVFGVMDGGFAKHEDLVFFGMPSDIIVSDHGNHVAAIGCAVHNNGKGFRGVLPNCFVRPRAADVFFSPSEGGTVLRFYVRFGQILATLHEFVDQEDSIDTFNVSLGYNWYVFGINPDLPESTDWRNLVEAQAVPLVSIYKLADQSNKVIFSAAGNDSHGPETPVNAKYASPFNWAAIIARQQGINSGIIVEAHDQMGQRASFSNTGGHISCPGVDVLSALALHNKQPSKSAYGAMSGTSMAAPYCAAGHMLLKLVRPHLSSAEAAECMLKSTSKSSSGTPMLRLTQAVAVCPDPPFP